MISQGLDLLRPWAEALWWLAGFSIALSLASLALVPWWLIRLPADYFSGEERRRAAWGRRHPLLRGVVLAARGVAGAALVLLGLLLLFLPGQGLLTLLTGLMVASYPGKWRLERWVVGKPSILASINWIRRKADKPDLELD